MTCQFLNAFVAKHAGPDFTWASLATSKNAKSKLHTDSRNLKNSTNLVIQFGGFQDGGLWVEGLGNQLQAEQQLSNGSEIWGSAFTQKNKPLLVSPTQKHVVLPYRTVRKTKTHCDEGGKVLIFASLPGSSSDRRCLRSVRTISRLLKSFTTDVALHVHDSHIMACADAKVMCSLAGIAAETKVEPKRDDVPTALSMTSFRTPSLHGTR